LGLGFGEERPGFKVGLLKGTSNQGLLPGEKKGPGFQKGGEGVPGGEFFLGPRGQKKIFRNIFGNGVFAKNSLRVKRGFPYQKGFKPLGEGAPKGIFEGFPEPFLGEFIRVGGPPKKKNHPTGWGWKFNWGRRDEQRGFHFGTILGPPERVLLNFF